MQAAANSFVRRLVSFSFKGVGSCHLRSPIGGSAKGTPRKTAISVFSWYLPMSFSPFVETVGLFSQALKLERAIVIIKY